MKYFHFFIALFCILLWSSCRKDFDTEIVSAGGIEFSADTIFMDTLFTRIQSSTQSVKVYNRSDNDITIPMISLERGATSKYTLSVDGQPLIGSPQTPESGKIFENINILAKDSIFIFIEATIDADADSLEDSFYNDKITFSNQEKAIELITLVKDATFIFKETTDPGRDFETRQRDDQGEFIQLNGFDLTDDELTMTNEKAYVIYGNAVVPTGKTLTIEAGARIHFHEDSGLIIEEGASLVINGTKSPEDEPMKNQVIIEGDRIAEDFDDLPGQWGLIWFRKGSINNRITNTTIKNATIGILIDGNGDETTPSLTLENVQIYNSQAAGIQAIATNIMANNVVINQSGQASLGIEEGGTYNFTHSTITNYFSFGLRAQPALNISNRPNMTNTVADSNLEAANFTNCIIAGSNRVELNLSNRDEAEFNFEFKNCLIEFNDRTLQGSIPEYDFENTDLYVNCIFNENVEFKNTKLNFMQISEASAANGKAVSLAGSDIIGTLRSLDAPDIGAYESIVFEEEEEEEEDN
ncbi:hypothetical protein [Aquimarina agarivorans]|uniref:hypothetical protein n=1 Tax=Aquimarina agarivorans TaxID=980584 RepID=UPI000248E628|nr:hypothetical protein [Aquimarina agarivorans]